MTTDEAYDALRHIEALRESIDELEFRALKQIACDRPKLSVVPKISYSSAFDRWELAK